MEGILHVYHPKRHLTLFEYRSPFPNSPSSNENKQVITQPSNSTSTKPNNVVLFIGGLFDNFRATSYVDSLAELFSSSPSSWRVMHIQLSTAIRGWGMFDLNRDVQEIGTCVDYIRSTTTVGNPDTNIVIMGHSTGCQDVLHYIHSEVPASSTTTRPKVQGAILQAAVSDRDSFNHRQQTDTEQKELYSKIQDIIANTNKFDHRNTFLPTNLTTPLLGPAPVNISRFLSLISTDSPGNPSMDDLFSHDLGDDRLAATFGRIGRADSPLQPSTHNLSTSSNSSNSKFPAAPTPKPSMLILLSGSDEYVPAHIDKTRLLSRWKSAIEADGTAELDSNSTIIENGIHDLGGDSPLERYAQLVDMRKSVLGYLDRVVEGSVGEESWKTVADAERDLKALRDAGQQKKSSSGDVREAEKGVGGLKL